LHALAGESLGQATADAASCSGDHGHFACEILHYLPHLPLRAESGIFADLNLQFTEIFALRHADECGGGVVESIHDVFPVF